LKNSEIVAIVREVLDLDEVDLPLSLIHTYMRDGFDRIITLERRWPFYETTHTLNTVGNQREYPISSIGSGNLSEVISVLDTSTSGNRLTLTSTDYAEAVWNGSFDTPSRPLYFTEWGNIISLYPKPDREYPLRIRGYRKPTYDWVNDTELEPDCDYRFHTSIAYYAISQSYKRQEDPDMSAVYERSFNEAVALARKEVMRPASHRNMVLSKGSARFSEKYWLESISRNLGL
jgi:hypothetical protein